MTRRRQPRDTPRRPNPRRRAFVLVIVLIVIAVLTLSAYTFTELMYSHNEAARYSGQQIQARALVDSGVDAARMFLSQDAIVQAESGGVYDNPSQFMAINVLTAPDIESSGSFTVMSPMVDESGYLVGVRYGLEDESTRLNLNALIAADKRVQGAGRDLLMALPGMTEDIADAILDWLDEDEEPREFGAETLDYEILQPPYAAKNGPLDTVEELLQVRGVTPELLFGADVNRNGFIDVSEQMLAGELTIYTDPITGAGLDRGWAGYLTLHSQEGNTNAAGLPRIDLNGEDLELLFDELSAALDETSAKFIILMRQNGPLNNNSNSGGSSGNDSGENDEEEEEEEEEEDRGGGNDDVEGGNENEGQNNNNNNDNDEDEPETISIDDVEVDLTASAGNEIGQVLDLVGAKVQVQTEDGPRVVESPFVDDPAEAALYMPMLMDNCTVVSSRTIPGRLNINLATYAMLLGIPGMEEEMAMAIMEMRGLEPESADGTRDHETWLYTEGLVSLTEMKALSPFICAGGDVFRGQVVGFFLDGSAAARAEVILDATHMVPRLLFWRDITHLGRGYPLDVLGAQVGVGMLQ